MSQVNDLMDETLRRSKRTQIRGHLKEYFPRIPDDALERLTDICVNKGVSYNFSERKVFNMRRLTCLVVAHVRHSHSNYERLLRENVERFEARRQSADQVWQILRQWCPWDSSNDVLGRCFQATLVRPEEREADFDRMDIDVELEDEGDPMDID